MPQERLKVLLIEHDAGFTRAVGEMLGQARDLSAEMRATPNLRAGLSVLTADNFDVVLFDVSVPVGAWLAKVSVIKAEAPRLPIIASAERADQAVALDTV